MAFQRLSTSILLSLVICAPVGADEFLGGTLHSASLRDWHLASSQNQLATLGDIVGRMLNIGDPVELRTRTLAVQACINRVAGNFTLRSQSVADTAIACMAELGYLKR
ncbi:MAG: hypothetical protein ABIT83_06415 [Massilia sp.]